MGNGKSVPLDTDPRCETLAPIWGPFVDAFVDTLHAKGGAVHPPPPRELRRGGSRGRRASDGDADDAAKRLAEAHALRSPGSPGSVFRPAAERLVAIGDLHGDLNKATRAFRAGGLIDSHGKWIGGATVAVQVGDQLDRGGDEVAILYMLERLRKEARDAGGELIVMNGNHETLNVAGRFRYAFEPGIEDFRRWRGRQLLGAAMKAKCGEKPGGCAIVGAAAAAAAIDRKAEKNGEPRIESRGRSGNAPPPGSASGRMYADTGPGCTMPRLAALAPGGPMAKRFLAHQPVVVAVGSTMFAHGGVLPHHVQYGLERINQETSEWIRGDAKPGPPPSKNRSSNRREPSPPAALVIPVPREDSRFIELRRIHGLLGRLHASLRHARDDRRGRRSEAPSHRLPHRPPAFAVPPQPRNLRPVA